MMQLTYVAKILIAVGVIFIAMGILLLLLGKVPLIGRLPGDIYIRKGNFTFYFPLVTSIILSIILSILFNLLRK
ncbi:MAG: DUF2905 domain-containing protein [bacterium]